MTEYQIFSIILSIILLPINFCCAFWLFREAVNLTGMTFQEFLEIASSELLQMSIGRHRMRRKRRFLIRFFKKYSSEPQRSIRLSWRFGIGTLPGLAALELAAYAAWRSDGVKYALIGNFILIGINIGLVAWGKIYRRKYPLDEVMAEKLKVKRRKEKEEGRKHRVKNRVVYTLVGAFFLGILLFFMKGVSSISQFQQFQQPQQTAIATQAELITLLNEKGYETANVPTTYWEMDEDKLLHVAAGVKGDSKFEFYGYSDDETVDLVYNEIVYRTTPELENSERESHEIHLSDGSKMFLIIMDDVYYLVMYRNDTVIYAYSPDSFDEINEILIDIGYLGKDDEKTLFDRKEEYE